MSCTILGHFYSTIQVKFPGRCLHTEAPPAINSLDCFDHDFPINVQKCIHHLLVQTTGQAKTAVMPFELING